MVTCLKNVETFDYVLMESFRRRSDALQIKEEDDFSCSHVDRSISMYGRCIIESHTCIHRYVDSLFELDKFKNSSSLFHFLRVSQLRNTREVPVRSTSDRSASINFETNGNDKYPLVEH